MNAPIETILLQLKDAALAATRDQNAGFFEVYLADDAVAVTPGGLIAKPEIIAAVGAQGASFKSSAIDDVRAFALGADSGVVTYRARFENPRRSVFVTTVYAKRDNAWRGVFYQQTPLAA